MAALRRSLPRANYPESEPNRSSLICEVPEERWNDASAIIDPDGNGPRIYFQRVPEPKTVKNRLHLDVNAGGPQGRRPRTGACVLMR